MTSLLPIASAGKSLTRSTSGGSYAYAVVLLSCPPTDSCTALPVPWPGGDRHVSSECDTICTSAHPTPSMRTQSGSSPKLSPCSRSRTPPSVGALGTVSPYSTGAKYRNSNPESGLACPPTVSSNWRTPWPSGSTNVSCSCVRCTRPSEGIWMRDELPCAVGSDSTTSTAASDTPKLAPSMVTSPPPRVGPPAGDRLPIVGAL
mmetsp:Transcript_27797/g.89585  ORF Transcript_27797/g.89585 Transcript_27797/m.89585 type:complete len:203 (-) Transcript_27797:362-970(-)